jgi:hypothetical protein
MSVQQAIHLARKNPQLLKECFNKRAVARDRCIKAADAVRSRSGFRRARPARRGCRRWSGSCRPREPMRGQTGSGTNNPDVIGAECRFRQRAIAQLPHEGVVDVAIPFRLGCRYEAIEDIHAPTLQSRRPRRRRRVQAQRRAGRNSDSPWPRLARPCPAQRAGRRRSRGSRDCRAA